jgi:hypothetical protein
VRVDTWHEARSGAEELDPAAWRDAGGRQRGGEGGAEAEEARWTAQMRTRAGGNKDKERGEKKQRIRREREKEK